MSDAKQPQEKATARLTPVTATPLAALYVIAYLPWEREWSETFEVNRARLLDTLSRLHSQMGKKAEGAVQSFLLGGQTVILEDIGAVRADLLTLLVIYNAGGRLGIGPWFIGVNEALVSGESLIRNLLMARVDAFRMGLKLLTVAYSPPSNGHVSQLPQIFRGFGIDSAILSHGTSIIDLPFRWEAPDGSSVLVISHDTQTGWPVSKESVDDVINGIHRQREAAPDGPFVWFVDLAAMADRLPEMRAEVERRLELPVVQGDLRDYVLALRRGLSDTMRPSILGELRLQELREGAPLWPGNLSARIYLKQKNAQLQARLTSAVEPWLAVGLTHGDMRHPENPNALLTHCWRMLLKNQGRNALGGNGTDAVHEENEIRYRQIEDCSGQIIRSSLRALPGILYSRDQPVNEEQTYVVVWNPHNWPVKQVVEIALNLPTGKYPQGVKSPDGEGQLFGWQASDSGVGHGGVLTFLADVPAIGYASHTVTLGDDPPGERHTTVTTSGKVIGNVSGETLSVQDGVLVWRTGDMVIRDLLQFHDGGDAGDIYNYSPPEEDVVVMADLIDDVKIESAPLYERLVIHHRMRVAPSLTTDRKRSRGLKLIELITTATFYDHVPGVFFCTSFTNYVKDHRLRVHLNTHLRSDSVSADSAFGLFKRQAIIDNPAVPPEDSIHMAGISNTQPLHTVVAAADPRHAIGVVTRGLPEYEVLQDELKRVTFALTLVRSVGWLSRDDLPTRTGAVAPMIPVPGGQCQRSFQSEYALVATEPDDRAALLRAGREFSMPLRAYQYVKPPERTRRSYLSVISDRAIGETSDGAGAILTTLKPPVSGKGWIARLYNPHDRPVEICLTPHERPVNVYLLNLAEEVLARISADANGRTTLTVDPHKIITVRMEFDSELA